MLIKEEQIIKVLRQYNPWWQTPAAIQKYSKPQKRVAYKEALKIIKNPNIRRFGILSGMRCVGKTTILYQIIEHLIDNNVDPQNILYITFDNPILKLIPVERILSIYESLYPLEGSYYLFFDEIQYADGWELWGKDIYDSQQDVRLLATSSINLSLENNVFKNKIDIWSVIKIATLSFYEYCDLLELDKPMLPKDLKLSNLASKDYSLLGDLAQSFYPLQSHFNRYLTVGGFPELVLSKDNGYGMQILQEKIVDKVIKHDTLTLFHIRSPLLMERLLLYLNTNSTDIFNTSNAIKELGDVSIGTLENYLRILEASNLIYFVKPIQIKNKGVSNGRSKIFIADTAIHNTMLMIEDILSDEETLDTVIKIAIHKHLFYLCQDSTAQLGYYRKSGDNQKSIDVVVNLLNVRILCEINYHEMSYTEKSNGIVELCLRKDQIPTYAFIITKQLEDFGISKHETDVPILRIPAIIFLYLLGKEEMEHDNKNLWEFS